MPDLWQMKANDGKLLQIMTNYEKNMANYDKLWQIIANYDKLCQIYGKL